MLSKRYTLVLADRTTGVVRRFTVSVKPVLIAVVMVVTLPILIGTGAALMGVVYGRAAADPGRQGRCAEGRVRRQESLYVGRDARARKCQLPRRDRAARRADHGAADGEGRPPRDTRALT